MSEAILAAPGALKHPAISFEFFPPKTAEMENSLWETINRLAPLTLRRVHATVLVLSGGKLFIEAFSILR